MNFNIDPKFLTSITIYKEYNKLEDPKNPTKNDLILMMKNQHYWSTFYSEDTPEFSKLRSELKELGFIKVENRWWNGDQVLKTFYLNGARFDKEEQFPCASAMKYTIESKFKFYK
jgi:hypothetical protein